MHVLFTRISRAVVMIGALLSLAGPVRAQGREGRSVGAVAVSTWNADGTVRIVGPYELPTDRTVTGTVAVLNGPAVIRGTLAGSLIAINADVRLEAGSEVRRDIIVIGGTVTRADEAVVGGEIRTQSELLRYTMDGELLIAEQSWDMEWRRRGGPAQTTARASYTDLFFVAARTYNRVEGLPIAVGPRFRRPTEWGRVQVEAFGIARTADPIRWDRGTLGHDARAEIRWGRDYGLVFGGRLFDVIEPVEDWQLKDIETGLATFVLHRDLRDHYGRHGVEATIGGRFGEEVSLHAVMGSERWRGVDARRPFSLTRDRDPWRANPAVDVGTVDLIGLRFNVDTRARTRSPWTGGWFVRADLERGRGTITRVRAPEDLALTAAQPVTYTRGFMDARRYTRVSPGTELNLRMVLGGQLGGDRLPTQRRFSIGGPGTIEGYDFRSAPVADDVFTCGGIAGFEGRPALCDRVALAQVELRQDFNVRWVRSDHDDQWWRPGLNGRGQWVLFADAGRGWTVDGGAPAIRQDRGIPPLSSFQTSLGAGVDFGEIGLYVAKSVTTASEPVNLYIRLGRRF